MSWIATWVEGGDPVRAWALATLLESAGVPARPVPDPQAPRPGLLLVNGSIPASEGVVVIPIDDEAPLAWSAALAGGAALEAATAAPWLPSDIVRQAARLLRDEPHLQLDPGQLDAHERLRRATSAPEQAGLGDVPIVDHLAEALGCWLDRHGGPERRRRWPNRARAAVGLSHDVDHPDRFGVLRALQQNPARLKAAPRTIAAKAIREARASRRSADRDAFWTFDALIDSEGQRGFTSSYFFAVTPFWARWGSSFDVAYDVTEPRFRPVLERLRATGNSIGLHTGYAAHASPGRIALERRRLEDAAGAPVAGNRHHYWHLGASPAATLREHEVAGFTWDASLAFNEAMGFRRSTSLPFLPWDDSLVRPLRTLQIPTACMDGNLFYRHGDIDAALGAIDAMLGRVVEAGGAFVIDWHLQASVPTNTEYRVWGDAYQQVLDLLKARSDVWVADLDAIASWWRDRMGGASDARAPG
ncbi:MAG: polysaccharide deacetylase family protein [Candidatus Limnocylindrales bacterium]